MKKDRGVAGLTVLLSVIAMLFMIGFLIMIFSIMGGELASDIGSSTTSTITNETITPVSGGTNTNAVGLRDVVCSTTIVALNDSSGTVISSGNYTFSAGCVLVNTTSEFVNDAWNITYTYTYTANTTATETIEETTNAISQTTDWFTIIVTISVMVVLILLTVIIINAIKNSGLLVSGSA